MVNNWQALLRRVRLALMRRGHSEHEADDLVQEAWIRLARHQATQEIERPEAFLMRAAINLSIDGYRARLARGVEAAIEEVVLVDTAPSVETTLLSRERLSRLTVCLGRLSERTRAMLLAHRVDGKSYNAIARQHQLSTTAVEKHIAKATLLLTTWMEGW